MKCLIHGRPLQEMMLALLLPLVLAIISANGANLLPEARLTRAMQSRSNDSQRQPLKYYQFNHHRCRYILNAFYLHCNMHSEVYSLFESLLQEMQKWMRQQNDDKGGVSMNELHELMTIARRAADELETISDYRRRAGFGGGADPEELSMIAVVPAVIATMNIPQRTEINRQLCTIAPRSCPLIEQFSEHVRLFAGKPWKAPEDKHLPKPKKGPLTASIKRLIAMAGEGEVECVMAPSVDDVDQIRVGLESAMLAALFNGQCANKVTKTTPLIDSFTRWASQLRVPRVALEAARPLHAIRHEFLHYMSAIPADYDLMVKAVTRAVNEKRDVDDIALMLRDMTISDDDDDGDGPESLVVKPLILAPLAFVSSLNKTLSEAEKVMPKQPNTYKLLTALAFASLQGGDDYYKLAEQVDHQHHMQRRTKTLLSNNLAAYLKMPFVPAESQFWGLLDRATRKGFKALTWNGRRLGEKTAGMTRVIARIAASFPDTPVDTVNQTAIDYWHALCRYTLAARTPFSQDPDQDTVSVRVDLQGELERAMACLPPQQYALYTTHLLLDHPQSTASKRDTRAAVLVAKAALLCKSSQCAITDGDQYLALVGDLMSKERSDDPMATWQSIVSRPELVRVIKSRLAIPLMTCSDNNNMQQVLSRVSRINRRLPRKKIHKKLLRLLQDTIKATRQKSIVDYMWTCLLLLQDTTANRLPAGIVDRWPNAVTMAYIYGGPGLRDTILALVMSGKEAIRVLSPRDLLFVNHHRITVWPPNYAVEQAAGQDFALPGESYVSESRLVKALRKSLGD